MAKQPYKMTKLSEIRPYERNPRIIPQAAVDAVAKSIAAFGFRQPIVVDGDGVILAGHTRYRAAQQLGLAEVPVVWQTDITPIQARGYRIADNKTAEIAAWDRDALDTEVKEIAGQADVDLDALGMSSWELDRILHECAEAALPDEELQASIPTSTRPRAMPAPVTSPEFAQPTVEPAAVAPACEQVRPDLKDRVLSIYYSDKELACLASALGIPERVIASRRAYTVAELLNAQGRNDGSEDDA